MSSPSEAGLEEVLAKASSAVNELKKVAVQQADLAATAAATLELLQAQYKKQLAAEKEEKEKRQDEAEKYRQYAAELEQERYKLKDKIQELLEREMPSRNATTNTDEEH